MRVISSFVWQTDRVDTHAIEQGRLLKFDNSNIIVESFAIELRMQADIERPVFEALWVPF
jgi:hypothetical protein